VVEANAARLFKSLVAAERSGGDVCPRFVSILKASEAGFVVVAREHIMFVDGCEDVAGVLGVRADRDDIHVVLGEMSGRCSPEHPATDDHHFGGVTGRVWRHRAEGRWVAGSRPRHRPTHGVGS
jgi:hypothetical protein